MIHLIIGRKGSGKTKALIEAVNQRAVESKGNVICLEKELKLTYDLNYAVKLIDVVEYQVADFTTFYGFIAGLLACNYDITDIFVDNILSMCGKDLEGLGGLLDRLSVLLKEHEAAITLTVSADREELPESVKKYL